MNLSLLIAVAPSEAIDGQVSGAMAGAVDAEIWRTVLNGGAFALLAVVILYGTIFLVPRILTAIRAERIATTKTMDELIERQNVQLSEQRAELITWAERQAEAFREHNRDRDLLFKEALDHNTKAVQLLTDRIAYVELTLKK